MLVDYTQFESKYSLAGWNLFECFKVQPSSFHIPRIKLRYWEWNSRSWQLAWCCYKHDFWGHEPTRREKFCKMWDALKWMLFGGLDGSHVCCVHEHCRKRKIFPKASKLSIPSRVKEPLRKGRRFLHSSSRTCSHLFSSHPYTIISHHKHPTALSWPTHTLLSHLNFTLHYNNNIINKYKYICLEFFVRTMHKLPPSFPT